MTTYFDQLNRQIGAASERWRGDHGEAQFLLAVSLIEARAARATMAITKLDGFPDDLKAKIARAIEKANTPESLGYRLATRSSDLISNLHSIFHEVATRKIETSFGVLSDDPEGTLKRLNANGKDAFEDHLAECSECETLATLGHEKFCAGGETIQRSWNEAFRLMVEGIPPSEYPK